MKNYHTHTKRCYHAIDNEEDYIQAAIDAGYTELGFSDHTPWRYASHFHSDMRMEEEKLADYVSTLQRLKEKYKDKISIKIGLECEYFPQYMAWLEDVIKEYNLDYIILGHHFDQTDETGIYFGRPLNKAQFLSYIQGCIDGIKTGLYSYVAHPDLPLYDQNSSLYTEQMTKLCKVAKEYNMPLEFNILGYKTQRQYPNKTFFQIAKQVGNQIIIGVDAHESQSLRDLETYAAAQKWLKDLGLEVIETMKMRSS